MPSKPAAVRERLQPGDTVTVSLPDVPVFQAIVKGVHDHGVLLADVAPAHRIVPREAVRRAP